MDLAATQAAFADLQARRRSFLETAKALARAGVRGYQVDLLGGAMTLYGEDGRHHRTPFPVSPGQRPTERFSPDGVDRAIARMRGPEADLGGFLHELRAAGCAQYFVHLRGRRATYLGLDGDCHVIELPLDE